MADNEHIDVGDLELLDNDDALNNVVLLLIDLMANEHDDDEDDDEVDDLAIDEICLSLEQTFATELRVRNDAQNFPTLFQLATSATTNNLHILCNFPVMFHQLPELLLLGLLLNVRQTMGWMADSCKYRQLQNLFIYEKQYWLCLYANHLVRSEQAVEEIVSLFETPEKKDSLSFLEMNYRGEPRFDECYLERLLRSQRKLLHVKINPDDTSLQLVAKYAPLLQKLSLTDMPISDSGVDLITSAFKHLIYIDFKCQHLHYGCTNAHHILTILERLPKLKVLKSCMLEQAVSTLIEKHDSTSVFGLYRVSVIVNTFDDTPMEYFDKIFTRFPHMQVLHCTIKDVQNVNDSIADGDNEMIMVPNICNKIPYVLHSAGNVLTELTIETEYEIVDLSIIAKFCLNILKLKVQPREFAARNKYEMKGIFFSKLIDLSLKPAKRTYPFFESGHFLAQLLTKPTLQSLTFATNAIIPVSFFQQVFQLLVNNNLCIQIYSF